MGLQNDHAFLRFPVLAVTGDQGIAAVGGGGKLDLLLERKGDTVDFIKGVREMGQMNVASTDAAADSFLSDRTDARSARPGPVPW
jgi:uncharacterized protein YunC (DUF1805 family)